jgi:hypothetical protein
MLGLETPSAGTHTAHVDSPRVVRRPGNPAHLVDDLARSLPFLLLLPPTHPCTLSDATVCSVLLDTHGTALHPHAATPREPIEKANQESCAAPRRRHTLLARPLRSDDPLVRVPTPGLPSPSR